MKGYLTFVLFPRLNGPTFQYPRIRRYFLFCVIARNPGNFGTTVCTGCMI